jgi:hypothetical protein
MVPTGKAFLVQDTVEYVIIERALACSWSLVIVCKAIIFFYGFTRHLFASFLLTGGDGVGRGIVLVFLRLASLSCQWLLLAWDGSTSVSDVSSEVSDTLRRSFSVSKSLASYLELEILL